MSVNVNFKSEEDVREYLKNLGIEYRFGCFKEKKPEVCHLLGDFLETIDKDHEKAFKMYQENCESSNFARSCHKCANYVASGHGGQEKDLVKGMKLLEKACDGDNDESCYHLSGIFMEGYEKEKISKDMKRSFEFALKACNLENMYACNNLSMMYRNGDGVEMNSELAKKYKAKAKELQDEKLKQQQLAFQQGLSRT